MAIERLVDLRVRLGPHHPATHGLLRLRARVTGTGPDAVLVAAQPRIGTVHRGAEKLFEARDYRQVLALANRHDWLAAVHGELGVALAVEELLGLAVPERATWMRTLLAELTCVHSHLAFLDSVPGRPGRPDDAPRGSGVTRAGPVRDAVQRLLESATGGRLHVMATVVGGVRHDLPAGWAAQAMEVFEEIRRVLPALSPPPAADGLAVVSRPLAVAAGLSGVVARASGLDLDLRRDAPVLAYPALPVPAPGPVPARAGGTTGDAAARLALLQAQTETSLDRIVACLDALGRLGPGPVHVQLPATLRVPEGEATTWLETPLGVAGTLLVSRGGRAPWRCKLATPSFALLGALGHVLPGTRVDDLPLALASLPFVQGDADR